MPGGDNQNPYPVDQPEPLSPTRQASVTLRSRSQGDDTATQLDPANQSLAEALGLVFRLLQVGMVVLFGAFVLSGVQSVKETESGIRLLFGKPTGDRLPPGPQFAAPYPLGEIIKVDTGTVSLPIAEAFWPRLTDQQRGMSIQQLAQQGKFQLKPGEDGSLITGDENLVHTKWQALYRRSDPIKYIENISPEAERQIVRAAIQRGVVHAVGQVAIDDFLKQSSEQGSVALRARELAQATLDQIDSGIQIELLTLEEKVPPLFTYGDFAGVLSAEQRASKARTEAESQARTTLTAMAGGAHEHLIAQIERYEEAMALEDAQEQERIMSVIRALMDGRPVEIEGQTVRNLVSGEVSAIINDARRYRSTIVSQRQGELASFQATLAQFRVNPDVVVQREWADAMRAFLSHDNVEILHVPPGADLLELWINRDIDSTRLAEQMRKERENRALLERRQREAEQMRFRTNTDLQPVVEQ